MSHWEIVYSLSDKNKISRIHTSEDIIKKYDFQDNVLEYYKKVEPGISSFIDNFDIETFAQFISYTNDKPEHFYYSILAKELIKPSNYKGYTKPVGLKKINGNIKMAAVDPHQEKFLLDYTIFPICNLVFIRSDLDGNINCIYYQIPTENDYKKIFSRYYRKRPEYYENLVELVGNNTYFIFRADKDLIYIREGKE